MNAKPRIQTFPKKDRDEILRLKNRHLGFEATSAKTKTVLLKEALGVFRKNLDGLARRPPRSVYAFNSPQELFASTIFFFTNEVIDRSILDRLIEDNAEIQLKGLQLGARLKYVSNLAKTAEYSGGYNCLHVFDMLLACAVNDAALLRAYIARHSDPAVAG